MASTAQQVQPRHLMGGWSPVNESNKLRIAEITDFLFTAAERPDYLSSSSRLELVDSAQQVVAGMNYRLEYMVVESGTPTGAFRVTVYDQFGTLSVTKLTELDLEETVAKWKEEKGQD